MVKINEEKNLKNDLEEHKTEVISFYAYKGGAGKTTALIKTALLLAEKGKRTAIIDMDLDDAVTDIDVDADRYRCRYRYG